MTEELFFSCNFKNCTESITQNGWVTICSHAFCDNHGRITCRNKENKICPACGSTINKLYDIVKLDLKPTEEFKSMVLAGLRPEIIFDICQRAIAFWNYQMHYEHMFKQEVIRKYKEKLERTEEYYKDRLEELKKLMISNKQQKKKLEKEIEMLKTINMELNSQINEKNIQLSKIKIHHNTLKRIHQEKNNTHSKEFNLNEEDFRICPKIGENLASFLIHISLM